VSVFESGPAAEAVLDPAGAELRGLRSVFADSIIYGASLAALPFALVAATPYVARVLGPADFGLVDLLTAVSTALAVVALGGLDAAVARSYFDYKDHDHERRLVVLRTALAGTVALSLTFATLAIAGAVLFANVSDVSVAPRYLAAAVAAFLLMPLANGQVVARAVFLLARKRRPYVAAGLLHGLLGVTAAVLLVAAGAGPAGYFLGLGLGALASLLFSSRFGNLVSRAARSLDGRELRRMLRYGLPIVPGSLAIWAVFAIDRTLLASMKGIAEAGYYGLASRISAPLVLAVSAFAVAWGPFILAQTEERRRDLRARALTAAIACTGAGFVALVAFAKPLVELAGGSDFLAHDAQRAVPGIALGWVGWSAATVLASEFAVVRKTHVIAVATGLAAAANVVLNLVLIPPFGFVGAAWVTAASFLLLAVIYWAWERRLNPAPYPVLRLALVAVTLAGAAAVLLAWIEEDAWPQRGLVAVVAAGVLGAIAITNRGSAA
jgi:O-antigen/teichoic acid export membrane protein